MNKKEFAKKLNIDEKDLVCEIYSNDIGDIFWWHSKGRYFICENCLENESKTDLLDFVTGQ